MRRRKPSARLLTRALRLQARYAAEDMIAELQPEREIVKVIASRFEVSEQVGRDVYNEAFKLLAAAEQVDRPTRRGKMEMVLEKLYRDAHRARQYGVCARIAKELKDLFGLNAPIKVEGLLPGARSPDDPENRTDAELEYYDQHGHWPEEAPRRAKASDLPKDPLASIH